MTTLRKSNSKMSERTKLSVANHVARIRGEPCMESGNDSYVTVNMDEEEMFHSFSPPGIPMGSSLV